MRWINKDTVLQGRLEIGWEDGSVILSPGDMIEIPAGVPHRALVVGAANVVSLDATKEPTREPGCQPGT